jgi:hypothetical protein
MERAEDGEFTADLPRFELERILNKNLAIQCLGKEGKMAIALNVLRTVASPDSSVT